MVDAKTTSAYFFLSKNLLMISLAATWRTFVSVPIKYTCVKNVENVCLIRSDFSRVTESRRRTGSKTTRFNFFCDVQINGYTSEKSCRRPNLATTKKIGWPQSGNAKRKYSQPKNSFWQGELLLRKYAGRCWKDCGTKQPKFYVWERFIRPRFIRIFDGPGIKLKSDFSA